MTRKRFIAMLALVVGCSGNAQPLPAEKTWWCLVDGRDFNVCGYDWGHMCSHLTSEFGGGCIQTRTVACRNRPVSVGAAKTHPDQCYLRWDDCTKKGEYACYRFVDLEEVE